MSGLNVPTTGHDRGSIAWSLLAGVYACLVVAGMYVAFMFVVFVPFRMFRFELFDFGVALFVFFGVLFLPAAVFWWLLIERHGKYTYKSSLVWTAATVSVSFLFAIIKYFINLFAPGAVIPGSNVILSLELLTFLFSVLIELVLAGIPFGLAFMLARKYVHGTQSASG